MAQYRVKDEFVENWGGEEHVVIVDDAEISCLSNEWETPVEDLMGQVDELSPKMVYVFHVYNEDGTEECTCDFDWKYVYDYAKSALSQMSKETLNGIESAYVESYYCYNRAEGMNAETALKDLFSDGKDHDADKMTEMLGAYKY